MEAPPNVAASLLESRWAQCCAPALAQRLAGVLVFCLFFALGCVHSGCVAGREGETVSLAETVCSDRAAIEKAISVLGVRGEASVQDEADMESFLESLPPEKVVGVLEELYLGAGDPLKRVQVLAGLRAVKGRGDQQSQERARAIAEKGLLDPNPQVAISALRLFWGGWGTDMRLQELIESRISKTEDPELLHHLFSYSAVRGASMLLAELKKPAPNQGEALVAWRGRMRVSMESCQLRLDQGSAELEDALVGLVLAHPQLAEYACKCLVSLRAAKSVLRLEQQCERMPQVARDAVLSALAILDPGGNWVEVMKYRLNSSVHTWGGRDGLAEVVSRYDWLCYVAPQTKDLVLSIWLVDFARTRMPVARNTFLGHFALATLNALHLQLLGLDTCTDQELLEFFRADPERAELLWDHPVDFRHDPAVPLGFAERLGRIGTRLKILVDEARCIGP